jgi:DNA-binding response OmpR family regulator
MSDKKSTTVEEVKKSAKHVLIIEDEHPLSHALELKFTHEGFICTVANNGAEGLKEASTGKYDVILLDLIMPEMDGFTFLEQLKKKTPVIVLSNLGQTEDRDRAKALGAKNYLVKSNTPISEIVKIVKASL